MKSKKKKKYKIRFLEGQKEGWKKWNKDVRFKNISEWERGRERERRAEGERERDW